MGERDIGVVEVRRNQCGEQAGVHGSCFKKRLDREAVALQVSEKKT